MSEIVITRSREFGAVDEAALSAFESRHALQLPADYRQFLLAHNGGKPVPRYAFSTDVRFFYGIHSGPHWASLESHIKIFEGRIPPGHIAINSDSGGNQWVLSANGETAGRVYFWDHEQESPDGPNFDNMS